MKVRACRSCSVAIVPGRHQYLHQHQHQHLHHDELWVSESHRLYRRLKVAQHQHQHQHQMTIWRRTKRCVKVSNKAKWVPKTCDSLCQLSDRSTDNGRLFVLLVLVVHSIAISARTTEYRWRVDTRVWHRPQTSAVIHLMADSNHCDRCGHRCSLTRRNRVPTLTGPSTGWKREPVQHSPCWKTRNHASEHATSTQTSHSNRSAVYRPIWLGIDERND